MSALIKLRHMSVMQRCLWNHLNKVTRTYASMEEDDKSKKEPNTVTPISEHKNWVSYGFDYENQEDDTNAHHASYFFTITLCIVFGGFAWAYAPDVSLRDWAQREAFLELRRREKAYLPAIDPNYVDPKTVKMPTQAQLCDVEIVI